jgi:hypothetical protein
MHWKYTRHDGTVIDIEYLQIYIHVVDVKDMQTSAEMLQDVITQKKHPKQTAQILSTYSKILFIVIVRFGFRFVYSMTARNYCLSLSMSPNTRIPIGSYKLYLHNQSESVFLFDFCNSVLLTHCKEGPIYVFSEMKLRGL